ncbi:MAG: asparagine--tRNA ligase [Chloroflexi bacterium]|nr:asparagine--tRNA ligase [Chloroflexota bacterium]
MDTTKGKPAYIGDIGQHEGEVVTIRGWVAHQRSKGKIQFIVLRDGTGILQAVFVQGEVAPEVFELCDRLTQESAIVVQGTVRADRRAPGGYELSATDLQIVHLAVDYPIAPKEHGVDFLMSYRHLWLRSSRQHAILRIRHEIIRACRDFLDQRGFVLIDAPILTPSACEGTTNLFQTDYFGEPAYLSQSGQLYMEAAAMAFGRVYCFGPTFRAEKSKTRRHLMEFWMLEPEMAWADLDDNLKVQEELVSYIVQTVLRNRRPELELLGRNIEPLKRVVPPFPRITYDEALGVLRRRGEELPWGEDFGGGHETALAEAFQQPFFVTHFPVQCKAFYMKPDPQRPEVALCADLLAPEGFGEIIGGGQRIDDYDLLLQRLRENNLPEEAYQWYLDLRRYGSVPHGGFGLGIERTIAWLCSLDHVRETIPFPRMLYRMYP